LKDVFGLYFDDYDFLLLIIKIDFLSPFPFISHWVIFEEIKISLNLSINKMNFSGKVILLTGASSGIGLALAEELSKQKCKLAILARRKDRLDQLADKLKNNGSEILPIKCDVTSQSDLKNSINIIKEKFGDIDIAILNAGTSKRVLAENAEPSAGKEIFDVNVFGIINFVTELVENFKVRRNGIIVGVSSLSDVRGFPKSGLYCASKSAASTFLESLRVELSPFNIKVLTVKPGYVKTPMTDKNEFPMPFLMQANKAAKIILKGIKKEKKIIQFPLPIVLGTKLIRLIPNFMFDYFTLRHLKKYN
jgi:short-subunit dehydrogenase